MASSDKRAPWHQLTVAEVVERLDSSSTGGLSTAEALRRMEQYGPNELKERGGRTRWDILKDQLTGSLTIILVLAAVISFFLGDEMEAIVILAIVILNAVLGYRQEYKAEQSMAALKRLSVPTVKVRREDSLAEISARELVPGDVVLVETGNVIPADGRVLESVVMRVNEAALTGESEPVSKEPGLLPGGERALGDRRNMVFSGTVVSFGHGEMVVTDTGMGTELGRIADLIQSVERQLTPLQRRLDRLGKVLAAAALALVSIIFVLGIQRGRPAEEMFLMAVSLAVAAIPEALTAVVTIALSLGAQRMLKRRALIRKLPAVETLGSVTVICSDKTGTLTQNRIAVTVLDIANQRIDLTQRVHPNRHILDGDVGEHERPGLRPTLELLLVGGALCNDAVLMQSEGGGGGYHAVGDPTEGALVLAGAEFGILKEDLEALLPRVAELPFDSVRKRMTTVHRVPRTPEDIPSALRPIREHRPGRAGLPSHVAFTKGAIDGLLDITREMWVEGEPRLFDDNWRRWVIRENDRMAAMGMRVLGVGFRPLDHEPSPGEVEDLEHDLVLVGLFGMIDPPRPEVRDAVRMCRSAGIRPVMITGDHPLTARYIAREIGIADNDGFLTGPELDRLSEEELLEKVGDVSVFARVSPEHKLRIVRAYQELGNTVAMTGDGVNDAPALKKADIGVAMGITGTDVAKDVAEMVLLDDNFATIVSAVEEGRVIFDNIRKFIKYLLSCNTSEIAVVLLAPFFGMPLPLLPLQILWMNLVTDGLPALALGVEPAEADVMKRQPGSSEESIFNRGMVSLIIGMGIVMSVITIGVGLWAYSNNDPAWRTLVFTTLIFCQLALALEVRGADVSLFKLGLFTNRPMVAAVAGTVLLQLVVVYVPFFQIIFSTTGLNATGLTITFAAAMVVIAVAELWKFGVRSRPPAVGEAGA